MSSTYLRTSTCLPALCKVRMRNACRRSTARPRPGGRPQVLCTAPLTAPCMNKDASFPTVHVQRTVKGIERKTSLNSKLL
eukprot:4426760-Amphidinium_carterae.1